MDRSSGCPTKFGRYSMPDKYERNPRGLAAIQRYPIEADSLIEREYFRMKVLTSVVSSPMYAEDNSLTDC
jgi:hypothetical protein